MFWTIINWFRVRLHLATKRQIEIKMATILMLLSTPVFAESRRFVIPKANRNDTTVINNLVMAQPLTPLIIAPPPPEPASLLRKPFSFKNNMPRLQRKEQIINPFIGLVNNEIASPFIINNVVHQRITTTSGITTSKLIQINPKRAKIPPPEEAPKPSKKKPPGLFAPWEIVPKPLKESPTPPAIVPSAKEEVPPPPEEIGY